MALVAQCQYHACGFADACCCAPPRPILWSGSGLLLRLLQPEIGHNLGESPVVVCDQFGEVRSRQKGGCETDRISSFLEGLRLDALLDRKLELGDHRLGRALGRRYTVPHVEK